MKIDKPMCNFLNCKYHQDGNCVNASRYENCTLTDLHYEIARLRVDLDNARADTVRKMQERLKPYEHRMCCNFCKHSLRGKRNERCDEELNCGGWNKWESLIDQIAKEMLEDKLCT